LSVLTRIRRELPFEDLLYVADSGHAPYGDKPAAFIEARAVAITEHLIAAGAKAVVVACNTATGAAAKLLRSRYPIPIIALEPALKPAVERTRSGVVAVMATSQTLASYNFSLLLARVSGVARVLLQPCPGLVDRVEAGDLDGPHTRALLETLLHPLTDQRADHLVLGCTHYPHLAGLIAEIAGPGVSVLDSGAAVARQVRRRLEADGLLAPGPRPGRERFVTSGCSARARALMSRLWGAPVIVEPWADPLRPSYAAMPEPLPIAGDRVWPLV
jgi:glutamate racemase